MPRNSSGIYTLPVAAFVSGTVIKSADMNSDLSDIATALTQSLATTGVSSMTAPLPWFGGTVTNPGLAVAGNLNTGIYQVTTNTLGITTNGSNVVTFNPDSTVIWAGSNTFSGGIKSNSTIDFLTGSVVTFADGTTWNLNSNTIIINDATTANAFLAAIAMNYVLTITIDGGGSVPSTGTGKAYLQVPCDSTVIGWTITADQSGSCVVDVNKSTYAGFPPSISIAGTEKPTLSSAQKNQDNSLTTWTTALTTGDILGFNLNSATTVTRIQVSLLCTRLAR